MDEELKSTQDVAEMLHQKHIERYEALNGTEDSAAFQAFIAFSKTVAKRQAEMLDCLGIITLGNEAEIKRILDLFPEKEEKAHYSPREYNELILSATLYMTQEAIDAYSVGAIGFAIETAVSTAAHHAENWQRYLIRQKRSTQGRESVQKRYTGKEAADRQKALAYYQEHRATFPNKDDAAFKIMMELKLKQQEATIRKWLRNQ